VAASSVARPIPDEITSEEYSVYSALIDARFLRRETNLAVIEVHTRFDGAASIPKEFENDMRPKINDSDSLREKFTLREKYLLLTDADLDRLITRDTATGFDQFWKTYPNSTGLLILSRVGFDATKTKAFLTAAQICGPLCGYGYTFVLEKQRGGWKITDEKQLWIS